VNHLPDTGRKPGFGRATAYEVPQAFLLETKKGKKETDGLNIWVEKNGGSLQQKTMITLHLRVIRLAAKREKGGKTKAP